MRDGCLFGSDGGGLQPHETLSPLSSAAIATSRIVPHRHRHSARRPARFKTSQWPIVALGMTVIFASSLSLQSLGPLESRFQPPVFCLKQEVLDQEIVVKKLIPDSDAIKHLMEIFLGLSISGKNGKDIYRFG
jgi:hypothetical protein